MSLNAATLAQEMRTAYQNAGKLTGMDEASKDQLQADWEFQFNLVFLHFANNAVINVTTETGEDAHTKLNGVFSGGVPVPTDGGLALQTNWIASSGVPSAQTSEGDPGAATGGIS